MKKILLIIAVALSAMTVNAQKCTWGVKGGLDLTSYNIGVDELSAKLNTGNKAGFYLGVVNNFDFCEKWGLQTELLYNYSGAKLSFDVNDLDETVLGDYGLDGANVKGGISYNTHTLRLPILAKFKPVGGLSVLAGPYLSYRMGGKVKLTGDLKDMVSEEVGADADIDAGLDKVGDFLADNLKKFDIGATLGVEYAFKNGIFVDARYNISFLNKLKSEIDPSAIYEGDEKINIKDELGVQPKIKYSSIQIGVGFRF